MIEMTHPEGRVKELERTEGTILKTRFGLVKSGAVFTWLGGGWEGIAEDNRQFLKAAFWIMCTGAPWRDLPPNCGCWSNPHRRFIDGVTKGFGRSYWKS